MVKDSRGLDWTLSTLGLASIWAVLGLLIALALQQIGVWPDIWLSPFVFGGVFGATAVYRRHPRRPIVILFVFVPVLTCLLLIGTLAFQFYVLGEPIEF